MHMLTCRQASEMVSQSLDRPLTRRERWSLKAHLLMCAACSRFRRQLVLVQTMMNQWFSETEQNEELKLSQSARVRMLKALASKINETGRR